MGTKYYGEQVARDATRAILLLLKFSSKKIAALVLGLHKNGVDLTPEQTRRLARYLRDNDYLRGSAKEGYSITDKGLKRLTTLELKTISVPKKWDGKWRLILFDVPEDKRALRDQMRRLIKDLRCIKLQQSVWIHPFACLPQFRQIRAAYGSNKDVLLVETDVVESAPRLVKTFSKIYPQTKFNISK